jgi:hypothetical protein
MRTLGWGLTETWKSFRMWKKRRETITVRLFTNENEYFGVTEKEV